MAHNFNFDLGNMPPIGWAALVMIIAMGAGKLSLVDGLFNLGAFGLGAVVIIILIALIHDMIN